MPPSQPSPEMKAPAFLCVLDNYASAEAREGTIGLSLFLLPPTPHLPPSSYTEGVTSLQSGGHVHKTKKHTVSVPDQTVNEGHIVCTRDTNRAKLNPEHGGSLNFA